MNKLCSVYLIFLVRKKEFTLTLINFIKYKSILVLMSLIKINFILCTQH